MQIGAQIGSGGSTDLCGFGPLSGGRTVVFAGEENEDDLDHRLLEIESYLNVSEREAMRERLDIHSLVGARQQLDVLDPNCLDELVYYCLGSRLVIIDTLRRVHSAMSCPTSR